MNLELDEFYKDFFQDIVRHSDAGEFMENAFTSLFCERLIEAGEFDAFDIAYEARRGIKVNGYAGDPLEYDGTLTLVISDFHAQSSEMPESLTKTDIQAIFKRLENFYTACLKDDFHTQMEETSDIYGLAQMINSRKESISRVRLFLVSNRKLSDRVTGMESIEIENKPVSYNLWDISRLHKLIASGKGREDMDIDFTSEFGDGLACLPAHVGGESYESYLVVIPGSMLARLYNRWGARLLEQNVRCFLQARGKINKGIRNTILNHPARFFAYNNGITATAEEIETEQINGIPKIKRLRNLQIVNGGQTTASIFSAMKKDKANIDHIFVQMKLSVVDPKEAEKIVPKISEYANSQNRINAADFFSTHPFHIRMEEHSRRIFAPSPDGSFRNTKWFYERARGQYMDEKAYLSISEKKRFEGEYPKAQSFTKTDLAKFENVWEGIPHIVSKGAQANFARFAEAVGKRWEKDKRQFNERYFRRVIARAIIFRQLEKLVSKQPWYGGYRANIVAYTISKLAMLVSKTKKSVDFEKIWREQKLDTAFENALIEIAEKIRKVIIDTPSEISNISEWAKKLSCWQKAEQLDLKLPDNFASQLITASDENENEKEAKKIQKIDDGIKAQERVLELVELDSEFWSNVLQWAKKERVLTEKDHQIIQVAMLIPKRIPSEKQSIHLTGLLDKLKEEACPYTAEL